MKTVPSSAASVNALRSTLTKPFTFQWLVLKEPKAIDAAGKAWTVKSKLNLTEHVVLSLLQNWDFRREQMRERHAATYCQHGTTFVRHWIPVLRLRKITGYNHNTIMKALENLYRRKIIDLDGRVDPAFAERCCKATKNGGFAYVGLKIPKPGQEFNYQVFRAFCRWHSGKVRAKEAGAIRSRTTYFMAAMGISRRTYWLWEKRRAADVSDYPRPEATATQP